MAKDIARIVPGGRLAEEDEFFDTFVDTVLMSGVMVVLMFVLVQQMLQPVVQSAQRYYAGQAYQGDVETRILHATNSLQYWDLVGQSPYTPLISVFFINRGASRVYVAINTAQNWMEVWPGETRTVSHVGADKRIEVIYYKCDPGNTSLIEAEGHF